jgi:hypothetical protein
MHTQPPPPHPEKTLKVKTERQLFKLFFAQRKIIDFFILYWLNMPLLTELAKLHKSASQILMIG